MVVVCGLSVVESEGGGLLSISSLCFAKSRKI